MAIILKGSPSESINTSHKLQPKQPGVELLDNGYSRLKIGSTTNLSNLDDSSGWIEWADLPYATPNPQIYTDTGINFAPYYGSTQQNIIHFGAGYHQIYGYSVGMSGGASVVRAGYNGNNCVELSADGTNWVVLGPGTLYSTSSTMTLGQSSNPWQSVYSNKYLSGTNTAMTFGFANGTTAFSAGYSPEALVPGVIKNLGISDNAWNNLYIKSDTSGEYYQYTSTGINCFTDKFIIDLDTNTGGIGVEFNTDTVSPLGSGPYSLGDVNNFGWESIYLNTSTSSTKGMSIKYNDDEECIEFLAE